MEHLIEDVFMEIQASNMSKLGADGKPIYREDGKVMKGEHYFKPRIAEILNRDPVKRGSKQNMKNLFYWACKAKSGNFTWLNLVFKRVLPFNAPHGIKIVGLNENQVSVCFPVADPIEITSKACMHVRWPPRVSSALEWPC
jgi:hypothetical protein